MSIVATIFDICYKGTMANELPEKKPPQNLEAEQCLLGCLMLDKDAIIKVVDFVAPEDFYKDSHKKIYQSIMDLFSKREPIDIVSVSSRLKEKEMLEQIGGSTYLTSLINTVPTAAHVANYGKLVREKKILRDLIEVSQQIGLDAFDESKEVENLLDSAEKRVFGIGQRSLTQSFIAVKDILGETFERIDQLSKHQGSLRGVPTGFTKIDNLLSGMQRSDLIILAARPSMGKSSLALDIARHVAVNHNLPVGVFSLEMSKDQIADRLLASYANIDLWRLRTGRLQESGGDSDFSRIQNAMGALSEAPIYIDDMGLTNILQMRAMARRLQSEKGLGLIIVDYLQLMDTTNKYASPLQQVTENSRALKGLARELNIPVLVLSQLSRAVEQRTPHRPILSDLRESGCLSGDTLITRADTGKRIPIKDLVGQKNIPVYSLTQNWKIAKSKISKVFSSGRKNIFEITTHNGRTIKASANHPFYTISGWKRLDELSVRESLAMLRKIIEPVNEELDWSWKNLSESINTPYASTTLFRSSALLNLAHSDIYWDKIKSIKPLGIQEVFDATVPITHNFAANDFIVHNSIEQDADVVLFIYRDDKYNENSLEKNIAEIIIAKHRNGPTGMVKLYFDEPRASFRNLAESDYSADYTQQGAQEA